MKTGAAWRHGVYLLSPDKASRYQHRGISGSMAGNSSKRCTASWRIENRTGGIESQ
jgi:hypothetical protein